MRNTGYDVVPGFRRKEQAQKGGAAVELALLLPMLMFLLAVAVDYSRIFYYTQVIENCARNGALYASNPTGQAQSPYATVQDAALADAPSLSPQPTITSATGTDSAGNPYVQVTAAWQFRTITNYPGVPNQVEVTRTVQMRVPRY